MAGNRSLARRDRTRGKGMAARYHPCPFARLMRDGRLTRRTPSGRAFRLRNTRFLGRCGSRQRNRQRRLDKIPPDPRAGKSRGRKGRRRLHYLQRPSWRSGLPRPRWRQDRPLAQWGRPYAIRTSPGARRNPCRQYRDRVRAGHRLYRQLLRLRRAGRSHRRHACVTQSSSGRTIAAGRWRPDGCGTACASRRLGCGRGYRIYRQGPS